MNNLQITLKNADGLRLTLSTKISFKTISHENESCQRIESEVNASSDHSRFGPWIIVDSCLTS